MRRVADGEIIDLWSDFGGDDRPKPAEPAETVDLPLKSWTVLVCGMTPEGDYAIWSDHDKKFGRITPNKNGIEHLAVSKFFRIEEFASGALKAEHLPNLCEINVIVAKTNQSFVVAKAPVFVGNQCANTRQYVGYNEFFGRVLLDASYSPLKIEQFKTYLCTIRSTLKKIYECNWQVQQIIRPEPPLKYYLLEVKVDRHGNDDIFCTRDNLIVHLRKEDLRQFCYDDLHSLLKLYVIAFKNQPYLPTCHLYESCFATLVEDFTEELSKNSLIPAQRPECCDTKTAQRAAVLTELMHNQEFVENFLERNPSLRDRLLALMVGNSGRSPRFNAM